MKHLLVATVLALALIVAGRGQPPTAVLADGIEVRTSTAQNRFPDGIGFTLFAASRDTINSVRLRYRILPDGITAFVRPQCNTGTAINCTVTVGNLGSAYIVPGAEIVYAWEIEDSGGQKFTSPDQNFVYNDTRFQWQSASAGKITVYFYSGNPTSQQSVLSTAQETIDRFSALLRTRIDQPLKIWVYATAADMQPAVASRRGRGPDSSVATLGEVSTSDTALVSRDTDFLNIVRHELAHIVTEAATKGHAAGIPAWINEGLSTYAQRALLPDEARALDLAIRRDSVLPITGLTTASRSNPDSVSLFYGQSGSIVSFLIQTYGDVKFADFIAAMSRETLEGAAKATYGLDLLGLENEWRKSVGLKPVQLASGGASNERPLPTIAPLGSTPNAQAGTPGATGAGSAAEDAAQEDSGSPAALVIAGVLLLAGLAAAGLFAWKRRALKQT